MVNVAIAGGTGALGRAIVEAFQDSPHKIFAPSDFKSVGNAIAVQVDYNNVESMRDALEEHSIHTVISALSLNDASECTSQLNLIRAADAAESPKRNWLHLPVIKNRVESVELLRTTTSLEWTRFTIGTFMDYFGAPHIKTYLPPNSWPIDMINAAAALPGDGEAQMTFTYSFDVAQFVVKSLDLPRWDEEMRIVGDTVKLNDFLKMAEEARGKKFDVKYDDMEKLQRGEVTELPGMESLYIYFPKSELQETMSAFGQWTVQGFMALDREGALNDKFPEVKTLKIREMLDQCWKGK
ncbi:Phenylcoumaran benzylic ether reductase PCBER like atypical a SDR [Lasiodiplodia theobromae]|uniref:Phenylcoumaran benzylic ether reductase PCBER like atypical a SDR n=1 Tax=Lasiodiplodia theobromae TaxID=45133 RepID=UPI0015C3F857|nr:Phenylcoumaran benzylic ether reductase PCBER like atypical a SDR [Lasiodiplodia theobromae]KAF4539271.1 Phenylcoumaran benzylic ether reductase PCBER like atypical a SDR [Lasiodiplodia theobromae]